MNSVVESRHRLLVNVNTIHKSTEGGDSRRRRRSWWLLVVGDLYIPHKIPRAIPWKTKQTRTTTTICSLLLVVFLVVLWAVLVVVVASSSSGGASSSSIRPSSVPNIPSVVRLPFQTYFLRLIRLESRPLVLSFLPTNRIRCCFDTTISQSKQSFEGKNTT